jgi:Fe-S cluster biogenesis protein NfuA
VDPKALRDNIVQVCRDLVVPLVTSDGGEFYLVSVGEGELHVHLAGTCAGCPGSTMTRDSLVAPAIAAAAPKLQVKLTTGWVIPTGAERITAG